MPQLTFPETLRYFLSPAITYVYFLIFDFNLAKTLFGDFNVGASIACLVSGVIFYYVYRYFIYDDIILTIYDLTPGENHRKFFKKRFNLSSRWIIPSTRAASRIEYQLTEDDWFAEQLKRRERPIRAAGIHLLFQAGILALPFIVASFCIWNPSKITFFFVAAIAIFYTAIRMDKEYERELFIVVRSIEPRVDHAANILGFEAP
jgi:hypothetical protein